jgi:zinc transport system ATP-binding protein
MSIVEVKNLSVTLAGRRVVHDVNFAIERGESVAVIGPNGSGKTVLLKAMLGILPYEGEVLWKEGAAIGYVPQKVDADRSVPLNARNLLEAKAAVIRKGKKDVAAAIARVGLTEEVLRAQIGQLSGGQFQRCLIAFALLGEPGIVLFDEPTASMDEPGEEQMYDLIQRLQTELGITAVVVSHDISFVYRYATRVLCLNRTGLCFGPPRGALTPELLAEVFGAPAYYHHAHR